MYTWIFILVFNMIIICSVGVVMMRRSRYRSLKPLLFILVTAVLVGIMWCSAQEYLEANTIGTAEAMTVWEECPNNSDKVIYHDSEEGSYFFVTYDDWSVTSLFKRNYLDPVKAAEFVELSSMVEDFDIDNMIISE